MSPYIAGFFGFVALAMPVYLIGYFMGLARGRRERKLGTGSRMHGLDGSIPEDVG